MGDEPEELTEKPIGEDAADSEDPNAELDRGEEGTREGEELSDVPEELKQEFPEEQPGDHGSPEGADTQEERDADLEGSDVEGPVPGEQRLKSEQSVVFEEQSEKETSHTSVERLKHGETRENGIADDTKYEEISEPGEMFIEREHSNEKRKRPTSVECKDIGVDAGTWPVHSSKQSRQDEEIKLDLTECMFKDVRSSKELSDKITDLADVNIYTGNVRIFSGIVDKKLPLTFLIEEVAPLIEQPSDSFILTMNGKPLNSYDTLQEISTEVEKFFNFQVASLTPHLSFSIGEPQCEYKPTQSHLTVRIEDLDKTKKEVNVEIENVCFTREWCGGFRNTANGKMYMNMWTQTRPLERSKHYPPGLEPPTLYTRAAQTHLPYKTAGTNTAVARGTQMSKRDYFIPSVTDVVKKARKYETYEERIARLDLHGKATMIQKWYRGWRVRRCIKMQKELEQQWRDTMHREERKRKLQLLKRRERMMVGMAFPVNRSDFYNLYSLIYTWKKTKLEELRPLKEGGARKAALCQLLDEEIKMVYDIERHKIRSKEECLRKKNLSLLEWAAQPEMRNFGRKHLVLLDTIDTQRARMLKEIYSTLLRKDLTEPQRVDVLLAVKNLLKTFQAIDLTIELVELIDRELDMINARVDRKYLAGLHKRIEEHFLYIIKLPEFNPRLKLAKEGSLETYQCKACMKVKSPTDFLVHVRLTTFTICNSCHWMNNVSQKCLNLAPYQRILDLVRKDEMKKCSYRSYCFVLQPVGMSLLVNVIWNGRSMISNLANLTDFCFPRWDKRKDWSPWNCILLGHDMAVLHNQIDDVYSFYSEHFIWKVRMRHLAAKAHLVPLLTLDKFFYEKGEWDLVKQDNQMLWSLKKRGIFQCNDPFFKPPIPKCKRVYPKECSSATSEQCPQ